MKYNWFEHASAPMKIILTLALMSVCLLFGVFIAEIITVSITGSSLKDVSNVSNISASGSNIVALKFSQLIQSLTLFILPPFLLAPLFGYKSGEYLKLSVTPQVSVAILAGLIIVSAIPFINYTEALNARLSFPGALSGIETWMKSAEESTAKIVEAFLNVKTVPALLFNVFLLALLPALGEELIFRGVLQRLFTEWFKNPHIAIIVTAAFFSAIHFQFYGFLPRMILGMVLGYLFFWSGSIWVPIIAHFVNNALGVIVYYFINQGVISKEVENFGSSNSEWLWASISLILMSGLLASVRRKCVPDE